MGQGEDGGRRPDEPVSPDRRIIPSAQHRRCDMQGDEAHRRQQRYRLPPWRSRKEKQPAASNEGQHRVGRHLLQIFVVKNLMSRSEEHTSELQSLMRISYAVFCLKKKKHTNITKNNQ